jgi:flagellin-like protein
MKRIWKIRRDEEAVSPVIATILMVAITVVLAAVLYVMVIGFGGGTTSTPAGSWTSVQPLSQTSGKLTFGAFTEDVQPLDLRIYVSINGTASGTMTIPSNTDNTDGTQDGSQAMTWAGGYGTATFFDYSPSGGQINSGDYITLTGLDPGTTYSFEVFHVPTDATVTMTGANGQFTTP